MSTDVRFHPAFVIEYVRALRESGVEVAYKEYEGCFHAFDFMGQGVSNDAQSFTFDKYADFYVRCIENVEHC